MSSCRNIYKAVRIIYILKSSKKNYFVNLNLFTIVRVGKASANILINDSVLGTLFGFWLSDIIFGCGESEGTTFI